MKRWIVGASILVFILVLFSTIFLKGPVAPKREILSTDNQKQIEPSIQVLVSSESPTLNINPPKNLEAATIIKVVDGDTITVNLNGQNETIRIIGINTPETVDPRTGVECFGIEASHHAKEFFKSKNYQVWLERDDSQGERDKYQRLLRYVFTDDGDIDYGLMMISQGYAYEYTYSTPYKYQLIYKQAQREAEKNDRGLWGDGACGLSTKSKITNPKQVQGNTESIDGDKDCKDFLTQKEAQDFFIAQGGPNSDLHKLDSDKDGVVCESLP